MMINTDEINILLIEDEEYDVQRVKNTIAPFYDKIKILKVVSSGVKAVEILEADHDNFDLVIMDYQIAGGLMGEKLITRIKEIDALLQVIVITKMTINVSDLNFADQLIKAGAFWFCTKYPGDVEYIYQPTDFSLSILNAKKKRELEYDQISSRQKLSKNIREVLAKKSIVGESEVVNKLKTRISKCAAMQTSVMITGPSGSGKELVAANIHYNSERRYENFVAINCGSIPEELIESELFGYVKGAFTGASQTKEGLFEYADKGTIFLDEVAELPPKVQVKLLRILQEGELQKIGQNESKKVDVRVISATNKDLLAEVAGKRFRDDLYYRLNVIPVAVPSLAERLDDLPILLDYFLNQFSTEMHLSKPAIKQDALQMLKQHNWPGNIRELKNVTQRLLFESSGIIEIADVENSLSGSPAQKLSGDLHMQAIIGSDKILQFSEAKKVLNKSYIKYVRNRSDSDTEAAKKLGLAPSNFHRICKEHDLK